MIFSVRLDSEEKTYILAVHEKKIPCLVYWGDALPAEEIEEALYPVTLPPVFQGGLDTPYQLNVFPEGGTGFRGSPACIGERDGRDWCHSFLMEGHTSTRNRATFDYLDHQGQLQLRLEFDLDPSGVLQRRSTITNIGNSPYTIYNCAAAATPVPAFCNQVMRFHGCWTGEFMRRVVPFTEGILATENRTGRTSHEHFPAILAGTDFRENSGTIYASHLGWSGNAKCLAETIADSTKQLQCAELLIPGEGVLGPNESYTSPWSFETCSSKGLNGISINYHRFFRSRLAPDNLKSRKRPVQFNTWEAVYFDHEEKKLREMAKTASQLGVERFVLDDGWFHGRSDDTRALGDWWPDKEKYPGGLSSLIDYVTGLGMEFGLWVEPEMVNENSDLFRKHPDWALHLRGHNSTRGRNQLVLDLANNGVCEYLFDTIDSLLQNHPIGYLKWDMNRILTEAGHHGKASVSAQTKALYELIKKIRTAHPTVEIETCASGGGRIDFEILKITERFWASDSNDPFRRLKIQQGASIFFPPEVIGSHIGPAHCHTSGRVTELSFRAMVALAYHFGAELNILELNSGEKDQLKQFIHLYKEKRELFHTGDYLRLEQGDNSKNGYGIIAADKEEAIFFIHQTNLDGHSVDRTVRFAGLDRNRSYTLRFLHPSADDETKTIIPSISKEHSSKRVFSGTYLMKWGLPVFLVWPGRSAVLECKTH